MLLSESLRKYRRAVCAYDDAAWTVARTKCMLAEVIATTYRLKPTDSPWEHDIDGQHLIMMHKRGCWELIVFQDKKPAPRKSVVT